MTTQPNTADLLGELYGDSTQAKPLQQSVVADDLLGVGGSTNYSMGATSQPTSTYAGYGAAPSKQISYALDSLSGFGGNTFAIGSSSVAQPLNVELTATPDLDSERF